LDFFVVDTFQLSLDVSASTYLGEVDSLRVTLPRRSARDSRRDLPGRQYPRRTCSSPPDPPYASRPRSASARRPAQSPEEPSSSISSPRLGSVFASRGRGLRCAASEGDVEGKRDEEDLGQSSVAEADADTDAYNVAEEMPDTIPYKSRDSADEDDDDDGIKLPGAEVNEDAVKPAKGKDRAYTPFFSLFSSERFFCCRTSRTSRSSHHSLL
jgi:hypothetical protein